MGTRDESLKKESQKLYCAPVIDEWWKNMRERNCGPNLPMKTLLFVGMASVTPGLSAKNLCYYVMDMITGYVIEIEVLDKTCWIETKYDGKEGLEPLSTKTPESLKSSKFAQMHNPL